MKTLLVSLSLLLAALGLAQESVVISPQSIVVNPKPAFGVQVFVDKDASGDGTPSYAVGEDIRVGVTVGEAAYIYLFNVRSTGEIQQILPNRYDAVGQNNYLQGGHTVYFPAQDAPYTFTVDGPEGLDKVIAVASKEPLDTAQLADFNRDPNFASSSQGEAGFARTLSIVVRPKPQNSWVTDTALFYVGTPPSTPVYGTLDLRSEPSGASAYVDGNFVGTTPVRFGTTSGAHTVRLELSGYPTFTTEVSLGGGQTLPVTATLAASQPQPMSGWVRFESTPRGAEVLVNGRSYGITPTTALELPAGRYEAVFRAGGYADTTVSFTIEEGSDQTVSASLSNVGNRGTVLSDALGLTLYPGATLVRLEQGRTKFEAIFETRAGFQSVFDDLDSQLSLNGWRRTSLETKGAATKLEARYQRNGAGLKLQLDQQGNSGRYKLEIEF